MLTTGAERILNEPDRAIARIDGFVEYQARIVRQPAGKADSGSSEELARTLGSPVVPRSVIRCTCCRALK